MARTKVGQTRKKQPNKKRADNTKVLLGNLTYLDRFPYHPSYQFNGFRSAFGAVCTLVFLFAVALNIYDQINKFTAAPPDIKNSFHLVSSYTDSRTIPVPTIGIVFKKEGYQTFYDTRYFKFRIEQGQSTRGAYPSYQDAGLKNCTLVDPDGLVQYENIKCPISDMSFQGAEHLEYFRFVQVTVEQCVNWTTWDAAAAEYVPWHGSTTDESTLCASEAEINEVMRGGVVTMYFLETDIRTDTEKREYFEWYHKTQYTPLSSFFISSTSTVQLKKLKTEDRYVLDATDSRTNMLTISDTNMRLADLGTTLESCAAGDECDTFPHLYRMAFVFKLDSIFQLQIRQAVPLYNLFMNFGGVTFFFLIAFGGTAMYVNKYIFNQQTKGLDLRKLDNSQFDKFGNLIDKSFQMPRELQDMTAE